MNDNPEKLIKRMAVQGGMITAKKFGKVGVKYTKKNPADVVTEADLAANRMIIKGIKEKYPDQDIISEEIINGERKSNYAWTIDPLDGTRNFATNIPLFCTMIALIKDNDVVLAAIYDPIHKNLYFAKKGHGAFLNGKRITCSNTKQWKFSFGGGNSNISTRNGSNKVIKCLAESAEREEFGLSTFGSIGISMTSVASGRRDWAYSLNGSIWDNAPVFLLLKEAGCSVTNAKGAPWTLNDCTMIAGNKYLQPKLLKLAQNALR